ncbi:exo-alpha-sialidase [Blastococcus sp. CT_GayMR16]|nr:exo-alpha-sialidase [Blastococcus sp. CT_GayMR16]
MVIATHEGLYRLDEDAASTRVGPTIDLMGFAVAGPGHYFASGHPGSGVDLPQPVGLIESTDGGETWTPLSRQGQSDFHALTVSASGVLGFDGSLARSGDGREWQELEIPAEPASLSASPDGQRVLATTQQGLLRSNDAGASWSLVDGAPVLQLVGWGADESAVGVRPDGTVFTSADGGRTWQDTTALRAAPQALYVGTGDGASRVIAVTTAAVLDSRDGGKTFAVLLEL